MLLRELLAAELHARRGRKEEPNPEEYLARFPDDAELIEAVFAEADAEKSTWDPAPAPATPAAFGEEDCGANGPRPRPGDATMDIQAAERTRTWDDRQINISRAGGLMPSSGWASGSVRSGKLERGRSESGRYRILRPHAQGGLGEVFVAYDHELRREVALKEIQRRHAGDTQNRARFVLEAEITGGLEHPGIVPIYGMGKYPDGRPFYAMRFVRGDNLKELIAQFHRSGNNGDPGARALALRQLLRRFLDVCNALAYAHSRGVLHRDVKPANILLGPYGETLVVDWGLAKVIGRPSNAEASAEQELMLSSDDTGLSLTQEGSTLGTPAYMSPEQARGEIDQIGPRSDVYNLGATLYCLLTGRAPVEGDLAQVIGAVRRGEFEPPRRHDPSIDKALEAICLKAMSRQPDDRYSSPKALADDIECWMADEPVSAWREPWARTLVRWLTRHRTGVTAAGAAMLVGLAALMAVAAVQAKANGDLTAANDAKGKALLKAREAEANARTEADKAQAINSFLTDDLLAQAEPENNAAANRITLLEVLDLAALKVGLRFKGRPELEDTVRRTIARTYLELGAADKSVIQWRAALALSRSHPRAGEVDRLTASEGLGHALYHLGQFKESIELEEAAVAGLTRLLGPDHPDTLRSRESLGVALGYSGRTPEAVVLLEANLKLSESRLGPDHRQTLNARNYLANAYEFAGRTTDAVGVLKANLQRAESGLGTDHPDTLMTRIILARSYVSAGRPADAVALLESNTRLCEARFGADHPGTLSSRNDLAGAYKSAGRMAEAIALYESTLKLRESRLGVDHPDTLTCRSGLAGSYADTGREAEAIRLHEMNLGMYVTRFGLDHPETLTCRSNLATEYRSAGRTADAIAQMEPILAARKSLQGPDHPKTLSAMNNLAVFYLSAGRVDEGLPLLETALRMREAKLGADHPSTLETRGNLGAAYMAFGRRAEAIPLLEATTKTHESKLGPSHPDTLYWRASLATAYQMVGRLDESEALLRQNLASRREVEKPGSPLLANDLAGLGTVLLSRNKWSEAESLLSEALAIREQSAPDDWRRFSTMSKLGSAQTRLGRYAEAESLVVSGFEGLKARADRIPSSAKSEIGDAGRRIPRLYKLWGKPGKATDWKAKLGILDLPPNPFSSSD